MAQAQWVQCIKGYRHKGQPLESEVLHLCELSFSLWAPWLSSRERPKCPAQRTKTIGLPPETETDRTERNKKVISIQFKKKIGVRTWPHIYILIK